MNPTWSHAIDYDIVRTHWSAVNSALVNRGPIKNSGVESSSYGPVRHAENIFATREEIKT